MQPRLMPTSAASTRSEKLRRLGREEKRGVGTLPYLTSYIPLSQYISPT